ncbi:hypothetical protein AALA21_02150 [Eggerthellaceae bacterium 3-80]|nr:hypothetical protein D7W09_00120 [bacterium D16-34]
MSAQQTETSVCKARFLRAVVMLVGAMGFVIAGEVAYQLSKPSMISEGLSEFSFQAYAEANSDFDVLDQGSIQDKSPLLPSGFEEEVVKACDYQEVQVNTAAHLIGFSVPLSLEEAQKSIGNKLADNQWVEVGTTAWPCRSYIKQHGTYRWLLVMYVQVGLSTSVVMQYQTETIGETQ